MNFLKYYEKLLNGPDIPENNYVVSGFSYADIYEFASGLLNIFNKNTENETLCLCTDNKAYIAASLLASIAGGPAVLLPHAYSNNVIKEMKDSIGFDYLFTDIPERISINTQIILPEHVKKDKISLTIKRDTDSLFLKLFTGGSTGKPKVWYKTPENVLSESMYHADKLRITQNDIVLSTVPPQHIYGLLFSVLMPFIAGSKVTDKVCVLPSEIIANINEYSASVMISIPLHYRALKGSDFKVPSLRAVLSSGGNLDIEDAKAFYKQTGVEVLEIFGSTETGGIATRYNSGADIPWRIMDNKEWKIKSEQLCIKSTFISPDVPKDNDNFFMTGDRVEKIDDSSFKHLGRSDGIIKVAGKRVDLDEVENVLKKIPEVNDAVVIAIPVTSGRENDIVAVIEGSADLSSIRQKAVKMLEPYSVPRKIKIVEKIPVLSTGKYDRLKIQSLFTAKE
ncbi:MAG: acyl--CoA ligase [Spirochaetes bacterium]|nr:acyl--CoA ligase [Spirochaetota bacterium]